MLSKLQQRSAVHGRRGAQTCAPRAAPLLRTSSTSCRHSAVSSSRRSLLTRAAAEETVEVQEVPLGRAATAAPETSNSWVPICKPEDLPKGVRKEVDVDGTQILLFWYRNQIYAIEARSPAEGAYSEGFIRAKFTQDYAIECPATGSLFSLQDGSIRSWYPNNAVLRMLTPQSTCRNLEIYPVKLAQEAIYVDISNNSSSIKLRADRGGAGTSLENNNVFTVQPTVYFEGQDPSKESVSLYATVGGTAPGAVSNGATLATGALATGIVGAAGTATFLYYEDLVALAAFWLVLGGAVAFVGWNFINSRAPTTDALPDKPPQ